MHSPQGQQVQVAQQVPRHPDKNYIKINLLEVSSFWHYFPFYSYLDHRKLMGIQ